MGTGDLRQPRLRTDFSPLQWVQHVFRFFTGHTQSSMRGHRVLWAAFNAAILHLSHQKGGLLHRQSGLSSFNKSELFSLVQNRDDLVRQITTWGAEIPTTSMLWKRESHNLEWIVRQMSWKAPRISRPDLENDSSLNYARRKPRPRKHSQSEVTKEDRVPSAEPSPTSPLSSAPTSPPSTPRSTPSSPRTPPIINPQTSALDSSTNLNLHDSNPLAASPLSMPNPVGLLEVHGPTPDPYRFKDDASDNTMPPPPLPPPVSPPPSARNSESELPRTSIDPKKIWRSPPPTTHKDHWGYQRIPAFWYTFNLPYNFLHEIH